MIHINEAPIFKAFLKKLLADSNYKVGYAFWNSTYISQQCGCKEKHCATVTLQCNKTTIKTFINKDLKRDKKTFTYIDNLCFSDNQGVVCLYVHLQKNLLEFEAFMCKKGYPYKNEIDALFKKNKTNKRVSRRILVKKKVKKLTYRNRKTIDQFFK